MQMEDVAISQTAEKIYWIGWKCWKMNRVLIFVKYIKVVLPIQFNRIILSYFFGRGNVNWKLKNYCYCKADTVGKENLWIENDKKGRTDNEENNFWRNGRYLYQTWGLFYSKSYLIGGRRTESCRCMGTKTFILLLKYI